MEKIKRRTIKRETLCQKISAKCNYVDPQLVNQVYVGLIKVIMEDIRVYGTSHLPDWGTFKLREMKSHKIGLVRTGEKVLIPVTKKLKFEPCVQLNYYIKNKL